MCPDCGTLVESGDSRCRFCGHARLAESDEGLGPDLLDQLGEWSQIKHEILEKYAHAYTTVLKQQPLIRKVLYLATDNRYISRPCVRWNCWSSFGGSPRITSARTIRSSNQWPTGKSLFRLLRRHPLACRVFLTESYLVYLSDRAAIVHPHHFLLCTDHPTIEVGRAHNKLDLHCLPEFFRRFPTHGLRETLALFDASRHALPLSCGKILLCRALEEQIYSPSDWRHTSAPSLHQNG